MRLTQSIRWCRHGDEVSRCCRFDAAAARAHFPILQSRVHGRPLVYLDNAATTQKPEAVIEAVSRYYRQDNANIHRGVHTLSQRATDEYESARAEVARFLNAARREEIVFVRGTTEAINLVAAAYGSAVLKPGDEVLITAMEHHSNIVPWQLACRRSGATLKVAPITDAGEIIMEEFERLLTERTRLVSVVHVSNALGTINPVKRIIQKAHSVGAHAMIDGAQAAAHMPIDVQDLDCDFYAISAHKMYGPTGIGALFGKLALLESLPPYQGGGDMIETVSFEGSTFAPVPAKFEAGTPDIAGAVGFGAALRYLGGCCVEAVGHHESDLLEYASERITEVGGTRLVGTAPQRAGVVSFVMDAAHPHDIGTILDHRGVAIRTGHHCAMPLMKRLGVSATARASFALYNTRSDVDALVDGLHSVREILG